MDDEATHDADMPAHDRAPISDAGDPHIESGQTPAPYGPAEAAAPADGLPADAERPNITLRLLAIAAKHPNRAADWPDDFAAQHDHYLHGAPRRP